MSNPQHGEDVIDRGGNTDDRNYARDHLVPRSGYYKAFQIDPWKELGGKDFVAGPGVRFGCWESPRICNVVWIGPY